MKDQNRDAAEGSSNFKSKLKGRLSDADKGKKDRLMQFTLKLRAVLVNTPADSQGMVPDTPFSQAGVVRMMDLLNQRAGKTDSSGSKVAAQLIKYLQPKDDKDPAIAGVSIERLQTLSRRTDKVYDLSIAKSVRGKRG
ncbi:hypothetical protein [Shimia sp.]|uniref:hypothetical protein n=1 Tax=Shimia sp. TaxID=1954381 RepID=UPI0035614AA9